MELLSPLLSSLAVEILLRRLWRLFPTCTPSRAYADDDAMVVEDFLKMGPGMPNVYTQFGLFSGLCLNIPKTVGVRLWPCSLPQMKRTLVDDMMPQWSHACFSLSAIRPGLRSVLTRRNHSGARDFD